MKNVFLMMVIAILGYSSFIFSDEMDNQLYYDNDVISEGLPSEIFPTKEELPPVAEREKKRMKVKAAILGGLRWRAQTGREAGLQYILISDVQIDDIVDNLEFRLTANNFDTDHPRNDFRYSGIGHASDDFDFALRQLYLGYKPTDSMKIYVGMKYVPLVGRTTRTGIKPTFPLSGIQVELSTKELGFVNSFSDQFVVAVGALNTKAGDDQRANGELMDDFLSEFNFSQIQSIKRFGDFNTMVGHQRERKGTDKEWVLYSLSYNVNSDLIDEVGIEGSVDLNKNNRPAATSLFASHTLSEDKAKQQKRTLTISYQNIDRNAAQTELDDAYTPGKKSDYVSALAKDRNKDVEKWIRATTSTDTDEYRVDVGYQKRFNFSW